MRYNDPVTRSISEACHLIGEFMARVSISTKKLYRKFCQESLFRAVFVEARHLFLSKMIMPLLQYSAFFTYPPFSCSLQPSSHVVLDLHKVPLEPFHSDHPKASDQPPNKHKHHPAATVLTTLPRNHDSDGPSPTEPGAIPAQSRSNQMGVRMR